MPLCYLWRETVAHAWAPPLNADVGISALLIVLQLFADIFSSWQRLELFASGNYRTEQALEGEKDQEGNWEHSGDKQMSI